MRLEHARINADFPDDRRATTPPRRRASRITTRWSRSSPSTSTATGSPTASTRATTRSSRLFAETFRDQYTIEGTVTDCSGVASIAFGPGSSNFTLEVFGNPGDTTRSWRVRRIVDNQPSDGELIAYDSAGTPEPGEFYVGLDRVMPVPALGSVGLALLGLIVALLGAAALGRRSTLL